jgi:hypothetical protein
MVKETAQAAPEAKKEGGSAAPKAKKPKGGDDSVPGMAENKAKKKEWTLDRLMKTARRFETEDAWKMGAPSSYKAAVAKGMIAQCVGHMRKGRTGGRHTA